jgi:bis(5'-nucleosyl)-tetraphosphatase (symmetrical)
MQNPRFRYAIGDVQGCFKSLSALLTACDFDSTQDQLWMVGDLVNRGPQNVEVLRLLMSLGEHAVCVLGNHDFFLLAVAAGVVQMGPADTIQDVLDAPDSQVLIDWLRQRPLIHVEALYVMVHAGLLPQWSVEQAVALAQEVQEHLRGAHWKTFLKTLWGGKPLCWRDDLAGWDRLRIIVNAMCRLRFLRADGLAMDLKPKGLPEDRTDLLPWYAAPSAKWKTHCVFHGHWSALGFRDTGSVVSLDSGCVWGGAMTAMRLEDRRLFQTESLESIVPSGWE